MPGYFDFKSCVFRHIASLFIVRVISLSGESSEEQTSFFSILLLLLLLHSFDLLITNYSISISESPCILVIVVLLFGIFCIAMTGTLPAGKYVSVAFGVCCSKYM